MFLTKVIACAILLLLLGCSTVKTPDMEVHTLGRAEATYCVRDFVDGMIVRETCTQTQSDAFSGWQVVGEITQGIASAVVKILTLGLL